MYASSIMLSHHAELIVSLYMYSLSHTHTHTHTHTHLISPPSLLFTQVQILSRIKHPFIISLVAVCVRPKAMLLLEYAELGSLSSFYPYSNLSLPLKHRIAVQVYK